MSEHVCHLPDPLAALKAENAELRVLIEAMNTIPPIIIDKVNSGRNRGLWQYVLPTGKTWCGLFDTAAEAGLAGLKELRKETKP